MCRTFQLSDVKLMCGCSSTNQSRTGSQAGRVKTAALIRLIFDACLRVSEALSVRMMTLTEMPSGWAVGYHGKRFEASAWPRSTWKRQRVVPKIRLPYGIAKSDLLSRYPDRRHSGHSGGIYQSGVKTTKCEKDYMRMRHIFKTQRLPTTAGIVGSPREVQIQLQAQSAFN